MQAPTHGSVYDRDQLFQFLFPGRSWYEFEMQEARRRKIRKRCVRKRPDMLLDIYLPLDRGLLEFSMCVYKVPASERRVIRAQQQRLHDDLRELELNSRSCS